jgi:hypothetical protein
MRKVLVDYLQLLKSKNLIERYPNHTIYMWSNFILNESPDVDIQFVGEVTPELALDLWELKIECYKQSPIPLDICMYPNTKLFEHIDRFNECTDDSYVFDEEIIRYKLRNYSYKDQREVEYIAPFLYKTKQLSVRKDGKYKTQNWPQPILLKDLL